MTWYDAFVEQTSNNVNEGIVESLNARGVSDEQVREFKIGYVNKVLPSVEYPEAFLRWCHDGAKLEDMYVFPLTNILGEVHGVQFRSVSRDRTGYHDYFDTKGEAVLFGLGQAAPHIWASRSICLVEGNFDVFPIQRHIPQTVATLTARVVDSLLSYIRRVCDRIDFGYDNDNTGRVGVERFKKFHGKEFTICDFKFPKEPMPNGKTTKDPGDLWEVWGDHRFGNFLREERNKQAEWLHG